jgi:uncharacterized protein YndB with AHSA1/START domain
MKNALHYERFIKHPPERVWKALTDSGWLAAWYMPNDFQPVVGHKFQFRTDPAPGFDGILYGEVVQVEPPHKLAYTFRGGWMPRETLVTWTLTPQAEGTLLRLEHTGFTGLKGAALRGIIGSGWKRYLDKLPEALDGLSATTESP